MDPGFRRGDVSTFSVCPRRSLKKGTIHDHEKTDLHDFRSFLSAVSPGVLLLLLSSSSRQTMSWIRNSGKLDPDEKTRWYDIAQLNLEGRGWTQTEAFYDRLPAKAKGVVRDPVWKLSHDSAGMCVRFITDATSIQARWTVRSENLALVHMPATAVSGLDLYVKTENGRWRWLSVGRPTKYPANSGELVKDLPAGKREYLLYLPLYNGVRSVELGLPKDSTLAKAGPWSSGISQAHRFLRHLHHAGRVRLTARHGSYRDSRPAAQLPQ